jgi:hypothetical protein
VVLAILVLRTHETPTPKKYSFKPEQSFAGND